MRNKFTKLLLLLLLLSLLLGVVVVVAAVAVFLKLSEYVTASMHVAVASNDLHSFLTR